MGVLTFSFKTPTPPADIKVVPVFLDGFINVTITNNGPSVIYPENLLINNATVWSVVVIDNLSVGGSKTSSIEYNWNYSAVYTFTLLWWSEKSGAADTSKEFNCSVSCQAPPKIWKLNLPIPEFKSADYAVWEWNYYPSSNLQFRSNMMPLPANMTMDVTAMDNGTMLTIKVYYYQLQTLSLFEYLGEKDYILVVEK